MAEQDASLQSLSATQIPPSVIYSHLRLYAAYLSQDDMDLIDAEYAASIAYVRERCGIEDEYMDGHPDIAVAVLVLVRDMWDNRSLYVDKSNPNRLVEGVLALHDHNLL